MGDAPHHPHSDEVTSRSVADSSTDDANHTSPNLTETFDTTHLSQNLKELSVRGGVTTVTAQFTRTLVHIVGVAVLARILTPADFGLLALVGTFTRFVNQFKDLGLNLATVQRRNINQEQVSTLFWINVIIGVGLAVVVVGSAPVVAWFYEEPRLTWIAMLLGGVFVLSGLGVQHEGLLARQMQFGRIAVAQIAAAIGGTAIAIVYAYFGGSYWSLVVLQLAIAGLLSAGLWATCGWRPGKPDFSSDYKSMLSFGGHVSGARMLNFFARDMDNILIGKFIGAAPLAIYEKAYELLLLPMTQLNTPLTTVAVPALSRLQDQPIAFRSYFRQAIQVATTIGMPVVIFSLVAAEDLILLVLGPQWRESIAIFHALGVAAFLGTFNMATGWVYLSLGHTRRQFLWTIIGSIGSVFAFVIGLNYGGVFGVAISVSVAHLLLRIPGLLFCFGPTFVRLGDLWAAIWRPFLASIAAGALSFVLVVKKWLPPGDDNIGHILRLGCLALIFIAIYGACWLCVPQGRTILKEMYALIRRISQPMGAANENTAIDQIEINQPSNDDFTA